MINYVSDDHLWLYAHVSDEHYYIRVIIVYLYRCPSLDIQNNCEEKKLGNYNAGKEVITK